MNDVTDALLRRILNPGQNARAGERRVAPEPAGEGADPLGEGWLDPLEQHLPAVDDEELRDYYWYALLGLCVGFADRGLSPYVDEHLAIIPTVLSDIRSVYEQLRAGGHAYSPEHFIFRAYDYGIHKAYYLDWQLYLSKEFY